MKGKLIAIFLFLITMNTFAQQPDTSFPNDIQALKTQINSQQKDIDKLYSELNKEYRTYRTVKSDLNQAIIENQKIMIDSLNMLIDKNSQKLASVNKELDTKIEQTGENAHRRFSELDSSLGKNRLYWIIVTLAMFLLGGLIYWLLNNRIQSSKTDVETQINNTKKSLIEESVKLDNKLVEVLTKQLEVVKSVGQSGSPSNDHSLVLKVADRLTAMETNHYRMDPKTKGLKQLIRAVKSIKENYLANGYEIIEMVGKEYKEGMNVIANFIPSEEIETGKKMITRIIKPQVNYNGKMIQAAQIEVSFGE